MMQVCTSCDTRCIGDQHPYRRARLQLKLQVLRIYAEPELKMLLSFDFSRTMYRKPLDLGIFGDFWAMVSSEFSLTSIHWYKSTVTLNSDSLLLKWYHPRAETSQRLTKLQLTLPLQHLKQGYVSWRKGKLCVMNQYCYIYKWFI